MRLDYGTQISPTPITLSVGTLKKPTLMEISRLTFDKFSYYEFLMQMTPELYYTKLKGDEGKKYWEKLSDDDKNRIDIFDLISNDEKIKTSYLDLLNFFFMEDVIFQEGYFILLKNKIENLEDITPENIRGVISKELLCQVFDIMQQVCCIHSDDDNIEEMKFKNNIAKKLYEQMLKAKKKERKSDINLSLPNIISSLSNKHPSLNYTNIWSLTIFQLLDSFNRTQTNTMYEIDSTRVSVWGDEKKTFDFTLWYKNEYDKNSQPNKVD